MQRLLGLLVLVGPVVWTGCDQTTPTVSTSLPAPEAQADSAIPGPPQGTGDADVLNAVATRDTAGTWTVAVTVRHADTGWDDYANGWDVVLPDGTVVKHNEGDAFTRVLGHPHVDEQPFTRRQSGLEIPADVRQVTVRAHELKDGFGGVVFTLTLPNP